jgi:predicted GH43/DUF377 family glycosyl hydrolase
MRKTKLLILIFTLFFLPQLIAQYNTPRMMFGDTTRIGVPFAKDPHIIKFNGRYLMYYSILGKNDGTSWTGWGIGVAESKDLYDWTKIGEINPLKNADYEQKGICAPSAIVIKGKVHLFYQTYGNGAKDAICHATSPDGINFTRNATNPIFRATGDWNCGRAIDAEIFKFKGKYLLYFATRDPQFRQQILGVAIAPGNTNFNRETWTQISTKRLLEIEYPWEGNCTEGASIIKRNGKLYMFYTANYNNAPQQIGVAESTDGITWKKCFDKPFLANSKKGEWNSSESGHPHIFDNGRTSYLFYQGNNDNGKTWFISNLEVVWDKRGPRLK